MLAVPFNLVVVNADVTSPVEGTFVDAVE